MKKTRGRRPGRARTGAGRRSRDRHPLPGRVHAFRGRVLACLVVLGGGAMTARAAQLQVLGTERWRTIAEDQTTERETLPASRGGIYDRNGRPLAVSREEYQAFFAPAETDDRGDAVARLQRELDLSRRETRRLLSADRGWLSLGRVSGAERGRLEELLPSGVHFEPVVSRAYPEGRLARALVGAVGSDGKGQSGLELLFDSLLAGTPGQRVWRRDARGRLLPLPGAEDAPARPGKDVYLTIDLELQEIAEASLERALAETGANGGDVILADPHTGELLAIASRRPDGAGKVPAFTDPFEPGSTVKPFLLATLLEADAVDLDEKVYVEHGVWRTPYRTIRDVHAYDTLSVAEVVRFSSNIGAAKLASRLSPGMQYAYLRDFGFGTPTGARVPSESAGLLRRPDAWSALSQESLAFGYELLVTSAQLVAAYGALANDGVLMRPELLREVRDADGRSLWRSRPEALRRVIRSETARSVVDVLGTVVEEGTGRRAALSTLRTAGKTGTARIAIGGSYGDRRYAASFVGFAPVDEPRLVVLTKLEDPQGSYYGGGVAAPVSQRVLTAVLSSDPGDLVPGSAPAAGPDVIDWALDVPPATSARGDGDGARSVGPYRLASLGPGAGSGARPAEPAAVLTVPDVRGMSIRAAAARLHGLGLHAELAATGTVDAQDPPPGAHIRPGGRVLLR